MKKKIIYIFVCVLLISVILLIVLMILPRRPSSGPVPAVPQISLIPTHTLPAVSSDGALIISGVRVYNFTKTPDTILPNGHLIVENATAYQIFYYPESQSFLLSILGQPFETAREQAEQELLRKLDVSQQDACRLNVSITTPTFANPDEAGKVYPLSSCEGANSL